MKICPICYSLVFVNSWFNTAYEPTYYCPTCGNTTSAPLICSIDAITETSNSIDAEEV